MSLRIKNFDPTHLPVLNRWADQQENTVQTHTAQLSQLHTMLESLFEKNPTLIRPNSK